MSGTIIIAPGTSIDLRTVDFLRVVEALRSERAKWPTARHLLESVDDFGMNMICADELDAADLSYFARILKKLQDNERSDESGFNRFLTDLSSLIARDKRVRQPVVQQASSLAKKPSDGTQLNKDAITGALPPAMRLGTLISTTAEARATPPLPAQWWRFIDEQERGRRLALLTTWNDFAAQLPSVQDFLQTMLTRLSILRKQDGTLSLLYFYTVGGNDLNAFRGRVPVTDVPEHLRPIWNRIPAKFRDFYTRLHDGWAFIPANSMGPLPLDDWAFLADDRFDIDDESARRTLVDIRKTVAVFHNGAGDYLCLNCADDGEASGVIWWHEDPGNPEPVDFWSVLNAWVGFFLEEADRHIAP